MRIFKETRTGTGFTIKGEAVMLDKYGDVYNVIDNVMHPNPGTEETGYDEIERTIDWIFRNNLKRIIPVCQNWLLIRCILRMKSFNYSSAEDLISDVMYSDLYEPCDEIVSIITDMFNSRFYKFKDVTEDDELDCAREITEYINENFLRVRAGGKLNPEGANAIYFRISSHGFNWHSVIVDFLWDIFGEPKKMPNRIWIGHDAETNPPEVVLFDGTPDELFEKFDDKAFESYKNVIANRKDLKRINKDRARSIKEQTYYCMNKQFYKDHKFE